VGWCLQEISGASNIQCKGNGVEYIIGASFKGINKYKTRYVLMQKNKTPDLLFTPESDACLRAIFEFHPLSFLHSMSFRFLRSLSALPYMVSICALSVYVCMWTTIWLLLLVVLLINIVRFLLKFCPYLHWSDLWMLVTAVYGQQLSNSNLTRLSVCTLVC